MTQSGNGTWKVDLDITRDLGAGRPIVVDGPGASDPLFQRILRQLPLRKGQRLNHKSYEDIKNDLQRTAATYGYVDARLIRNELVVDPPNHTANIALELQTGERYRFGTTTIKQHVVKESLVRRYLRYHEGEPFDLTQVLRSQFALDDSQYFANLEVLPGEPDRNAHTVPVNISADASRRHRYSVGAGYATDTGVRGTLGFDDHRINSSGHTFSIEAQAAQVTKYSLQARYTMPVGDPAVENLSVRGSAEQRDWGDVTTNTLSVGPAFTAVTGGWQHVWLINAVRTNTRANDDRIEDWKASLRSSAGTDSTSHPYPRATWGAAVRAPAVHRDQGLLLLLGSIRTSAGPRTGRARLREVAPAGARGGGRYGGAGVRRYRRCSVSSPAGTTACVASATRSIANTSDDLQHQTRSSRSRPPAQPPGYIYQGRRQNVLTGSVR